MAKYWGSYFVLLGIVLVIQGIGGIINALGYDLLNGLFFVNHLAVFDGFEILVNAVVAFGGIGFIAIGRGNIRKHNLEKTR